MTKATGSVIAASLILLSVFPSAYGIDSAKTTDGPLTNPYLKFLSDLGIPVPDNILKQFAPLNASIPEKLAPPQQVVVTSVGPPPSNDECQGALIVQNGLYGPYDTAVSKDAES